MRRTLFSCALLSLTLIYCFGDENEQTQTFSNTAINWTLVFQDDFTGTAVNQSNWDMYDSPGNGGNGLRRPEAFSIEDGLLVVTAQMKNGVLVSGGMAHRQDYTYGKFEFRVRTEPDPSQATSGVVLTWPKSENWPTDGENDIYETGTSAVRDHFDTYIHYGVNNSQYNFLHEADATEWHIIAMEWSNNAIKIYRDGKLVYTLSDTNAIPDVPHHLCIQLDAFKTKMAGVVKMYVDLVKIYQPTVVNGVSSVEVNSNVCIFPNPVSKYLNINSPYIQTLQSYYIYSVDGKMVKSARTAMSRIDCNDLKSGLYYMKANFKEKSETVRFIKL